MVICMWTVNVLDMLADRANVIVYIKYKTITGLSFHFLYLHLFLAHPIGRGQGYADFTANFL